MSDLRIFSYLPNPRIWKSTIAARFCGVDIDIRGGQPGELSGWLWDFDARPLSDDELAAPPVPGITPKTGFNVPLYKTEAFLEAHPFGTVPAAFSPDGKTGIFESNSIMRAVARIGADKFPLYGSDPYSAARIDSYLDTSLVFARDSQIYLLSFRDGSTSKEIHERTAKAFAVYMTGIERGLAPNRDYLVGDDVTLADICFACEFTLMSRDRTAASRLASLGLGPICHDRLADEYPRAMAHYAKLCAHPAFAPDMAPYRTKLAADIADDRAKQAARSAAAE